MVFSGKGNFLNFSLPPYVYILSFSEIKGILRYLSMNQQFIAFGTRRGETKTVVLFPRSPSIQLYNILKVPLCHSYSFKHMFYGSFQLLLFCDTNDIYHTLTNILKVTNATVHWLSRKTYQ